MNLARFNQRYERAFVLQGKEDIRYGACGVGYVGFLCGPAPGCVPASVIVPFALTVVHVPVTCNMQTVVMTATTTTAAAAAAAGSPFSHPLAPCPLPIIPAVPVCLRVLAWSVCHRPCASLLSSCRCTCVCVSWERRHKELLDHERELMQVSESETHGHLARV